MGCRGLAIFAISILSPLIAIFRYDLSEFTWRFPFVLGNFFDQAKGIWSESEA